MDEMLHGISPPPPHIFDQINHNLISYSNQIYLIDFLHPGVGLRPPSTIPYGIDDGADTTHSELFHGSTC